MANDTTVYTLYPEADLDERVRYFDGQFLGSQDFVDAQRYLIDRLRRGFDLGTVAGVAAGLRVTATDAWTLKIAAGTAIDPRGRMLVLPSARDNVDVPRELGGKAVDVALVYGEVEDRVQGGTAEEAGTRGATRIREVPSVIFYAAGQAPPEAGAVPLARLNVAADGTCAAVDPDPVRKRAGVSFPTEDGVEPPYLRAGGPARPRTLETDASVAIADKLIVGGLDPQSKLDVRGLAKLDALHVRSKSFRVGGDAAKFYPIVWQDNGWADGAFTLEVTRANSNADATNAGSLVAQFRLHASDGHGSAFVEHEIHQTKRFVASYNMVVASGRHFVVWLRGDRTYSWRASQDVALVDAEAKAKSVAGVNHGIKSGPNDFVDYDRVKGTSQVDLFNVRGNAQIDGNLTYSGLQSKLDTAEQGAATIRAYDLNFGHSARHGGTGRALVDLTNTLALNYGGDWASTAIQSPLAVTGNTTIGGTLTVGTDSARKDLTVNGAIAADLTLTIGGYSHLKGAVTIGQDADRKNLTLHGGASVANFLTVDGGTTLKGNVTIGQDAARRTLTVNGKITADQTLDVGGNTALGGTLSVGGATTLSGALTVNSGVVVAHESSHMILRRAMTETAGGAKVFLELHQNDASPPKVPEVGTCIRFHHGNRYWHRIEGNGSGLHFRTGDLNKDDYTPAFTGALRVHGRATVNQLDVTTATFKVGGDRAKFYPIVFNQDGHADGPYEFEINRPDVHTDGQWVGSMVSLFRGHMSNWGHGSNFHEVFANQYKQRFIANVHHHRESARIVVWLRGDCTYRWRARTAVSLVDFRAQRKKLGDEYQNVLDSIAGQYDKDRFYVGPVASGMNEYDLKIVRGTVDAGGSRIAGSGFSVSSHSSSKWRKITYDTAFGGEVTVVATQQYPNDNNEDDSGDTRDNAVVISSQKTHCYIKCGGSNGDGSWRRFHFIAMGQG